jgi:hypothetical protein
MIISQVLLFSSTVFYFVLVSKVFDLFSDVVLKKLFDSEKLGKKKQNEELIKSQ